VWTNDNPVRTDAAVWIYHYDGDSVFVAPPTTLKAPFTPDEFEKDEENALASGSGPSWSSLAPATPWRSASGSSSSTNSTFYDRTFAVRVQPTGGIVGMPWTSTADASFVHDAGQSVAVCEDGFLVGGWTRDEPPDAEPDPTIFWFDNGVALEAASIRAAVASQLRSMGSRATGRTR
jgi:hypothetical protein